MKRSVVRFSLGLALVAGLLSLSACSGGSGSGSSSAQAQFDPEVYRAEIQAVEAVLYKQSPPDYADPGRAAAALTQLFDAIDHNEPDRTKRQRAQTLMFLSSRADQTDVGYAAPSLRATRDEWEKARHELFGDADWFRTSSPDVAAAQTRTVPRPTEGQVYELTRVIDRLDDVVRDGRRECDQLGEPVYEPGFEGAEGRVQVERWGRFAIEWNERLDDTAKSFPAAPALDGDVDFTMAYQGISNAFSELRAVPVGVGDWATPFAYQWQQHFASAEAYLSEARTRLERLQ